jgi:26S proteasome regulatory subunit N3
MDVDSAAPVTQNPPRHTNVEPVPEVEIYLRLLLIHFLLNDKSTYSKAMQLSQETVQKMQSLNRRSMDPIAAKVWYAVERTYELAGELAEARP